MGAQPALSVTEKLQKTSSQTNMEKVMRKINTKIDNLGVEFKSLKKSFSSVQSKVDKVNSKVDREILELRTITKHLKKDQEKFQYEMKKDQEKFQYEMQEKFSWILLKLNLLTVTVCAVSVAVCAVCLTMYQ